MNGTGSARTDSLPLMAQQGYSDHRTTALHIIRVAICATGEKELLLYFTVLPYQQSSVYNNEGLNDL